MMVYRCALLLILSASAVYADHPLSNVTFDDDHDVFYQEQFHTLQAHAKEAIPRAYKSVIQQWNLRDTGGLVHPLTVQIKKLDSDTLVRTKVAYVQPQGFGSGLQQFLVIDIGCYMQHPDEDIDSILTHEMAHVILLDIESEASAAPIPPWFNEGLAQSVTSEGSKRVRTDIMWRHRSGAPLLLCDLEGPVDEFGHGPFNLNGGCYPEYYLAVQRLKQLGGPQTLPKVINGLRQGTKMPDIIASITGMDWPSFKKEVNQYSTAVFEGEKPVPQEPASHK
jgi:hypothetical protein